jgi:hypothetical protein
MLFCAAFGLRQGHADNLEYVVLLPGTSCSIVVGDVNISKFRMLIPARQLAATANKTGILRIHVCECLLMGGDPQVCAIAAVTKAARHVRLTQDDERRLDGRIFVYIEKAADFGSLYSTLSSNYAPRTSNLAWKILHEPATPDAAPGATQTSPAGSENDAGGPHPPSPPSSSMSSHGNEKADNNKKNHCELESNVCINPATNEPSAEFELKCEGLPTIVFSTDGKAGLKIGPLEVSVSAHGGKEH